MNKKWQWVFIKSKEIYCSNLESIFTHIFDALLSPDTLFFPLEINKFSKQKKI